MFASKAIVQKVVLRHLFSSTVAPTGNALKAFLLEYMYVDNMLEKRAPHRAAHLDYANEFVEKNILIAGGAVQPAIDRGVLVFKAENADVVEQFAKNDPYVIKGLVKNYTVKEWAVVVGKV